MSKLCTLVLCFLITASQLLAQTTAVTGRVTDDKGQPLEGATVLEKNTKNGTLTDSKGVFKLSVKPGAILVISEIGFEKIEVKSSSSSIGVSLKVFKDDLSEVIVTAQGISKTKKSLGYAVSTVGKELLEQRPETDVVRILNGKAPGVNIINTSGLSGSGTNINIRGISTITGSSQPLFIVDGVPFDGGTNANSNFTFGNQTTSRFLDLDPNNIENISILKGLSATTFYGEAGRNGVILITTKSGTSKKARKKTEISVTQSVFATQAILPEYNESYGGGFDLSLGIAFFSNWGARFTNPPAQVKHPYDKPALNAAFPEYKGVLYDYKYYNSVPKFFRTGINSTTSINANGANDNSSYNLSYTYTDDQGYLTGNGLYKNALSMGGTSKLSNHFTVSGTVNYTTSKVISPPVSTSFGSNPTNASIFGNVMYTPTAVDLNNLPYENPFTHGSLYYRNNNDIQNPRWTLNNSFVKNNTSRIFGKGQIQYELNKHFNVTYRFGFDNYTESQEYSQNKGGIQTPNGILRTSTGLNTILDHSLLTSYNTNLNSDFSLTIDGGVNSRRLSYSQTGLFSQQQLVYGLLNHGNFVSHDVYGEDGSILNYEQETLAVGVFAQANIDYKEYAFLTIGGRNSWSSTVEKDNRSIFYPSASISFIPTSAFESLKSNKGINYLKFRVGYATSANFPSPYTTRAALNIATRSFLSSGGTPINTNSIPNLLPNPNLKPELLGEIEAGVEGMFFDNRVSADITLYSKKSNNQILFRDLDPSTGYTRQQINAGSVSNKGIEIALGYTVIKKKNLSWQLDALYTLNKSLVNDIPDGIKQIITGGFTNLGTFAKNGSPLGVIMGYAFQRDPSGKTNQRLVEASTGNYLTANEISVLGDPNAQYRLNGISTLTYKQFSFRVQVDYSVGGVMYAGTAGTLLGRGVTKDTEFDRALPFILPGVDANGKQNTVQISATQAYFNNTVAGGAADEASIYDATFVKLREASLSYSIPAKFLDKSPFGSISISLTGSNLWYYAPNFPKYVHFDPEVNGLGVGNGRGLDFLSGPSARRFGASVKVTF
ncbi:MAG: SusC/RagA family TonB-linked outer membrane protein [Deinococcales bacterium]|nr:SusC/RagA family TonB-linked outer membrane protein [Chitinophagaceae bacterium]